MPTDHPATVDRIEMRSGADHPASEVFDRWEASLSDFYVPLAVTPGGSGSFRGWISRGRYADVELSTLGAAPQHVRRTRSLIARTDDEFLTATIQTRGRGRMYQDDRVADVGPGTMVFYDSTRPYRFDLETEWSMAVVQVPLRRLREHGIGTDDLPTAIALPGTSPAGLVSRYFRQVADLQDAGSEEAARLAGPALDLLAAAVSFASGIAVSQRSAAALGREQVLAFMRAHCADPALTVDRIADGCVMSRRTLYRIFDDLEEGPAAALRRMRVERACQLLLREPPLSIAAVANYSGFLTERHFYRAFRHEKGMTPAVFRMSEPTETSRRDR
ncbi:helix-turn-helix domain-containing protein [Nocardia sp. NPDC050406]|uniref:AraC-like ligand-binding domain-containing protein n=1 Tax=Nocardia sp. NPDC050406 TaxID=3364318 RepID=UPI0037B554DB